jgi:hypothetical protein
MDSISVAIACSTSGFEVLVSKPPRIEPKRKKEKKIQLVNSTNNSIDDCHHNMPGTKIACWGGRE